MKQKILLIFMILFFENSYGVKALDIAVEATSIKLEYIESSNRGIIYPKQCEQCTQSYYEFTQAPKIIKNEKSISFENFLEDYWNAKYTTLLLDKKSLAVLKVVY